MKITCHSCGAKYAIADDKVRGRRVKVRCKSCKTAIVVDGSAPEEASSDAYGGHGETNYDDDSTRVQSASQAELGGGGSWSVNLTDTDQRTMSSEEIAYAWQSGELTADAYVWREGMDDWLGVFDVPELASLLGQGQAPAQDAYAPPAPSQPPAASQPPWAAAPAATPFGSPGGFGLGSSPEPARVNPGRAQQSRDLFGAAAEGHAEVATPGAEPYDDHRLTGARNENSVLFSLDALKAGIGPTKSAPSAPKPKDDKANLDDLMGMGGGGSNALFGLAQNQSLLSAPAPPPEPPPRPVLPSDPGLGAAASVFPAAAPPKKNNTLVFALGGAVVLLLLLVVVLGGAAFLGGKDDQELAKADPAAKDSKNEGDKSSSGTAGGDKPDDTDNSKEATAKPADEPGATDDATGDKVPVTEEDKKRFAEAQKKKEEEKAAGKTETDEAAKKEEAVAKKEEPSTGVASFNKQAAIASLSSAASSATRCKRPDGPTGTGRAIVTFAPSGRVTSATVSGGSYGGTSVGGCVAGVFRSARVPAFSGDAVTVSKSFNIP